MTDIPLTPVEVRVLGALIEKEATTPDAYPLSMSGLVAACNQATNREPVMQLDEAALAEAVTLLRRRSYLRAIQPAGSRVTKYQHLLADAFDLDRRELAVLAVLMLRGPQTPGELHARTARLATFDGAAQLEATLDALARRDAGPLVARLERRAGQKETRWAQLLGGVPAPGDDAAASFTTVRAEPGDDRVEELAREVEALRSELATLRERFAEFRAQFQ